MKNAEPVTEVVAGVTLAVAELVVQATKAATEVVAETQVETVAQPPSRVPSPGFCHLHLPPAPSVSASGAAVGASPEAGEFQVADKTQPSGWRRFQSQAVYKCTGSS